VSAGACVGIVANPASGRDIRRLVAGASVFGNADKAGMVYRLLTGLGAAGVESVLMMPAGDGLSSALHGQLAGHTARAADGGVPFPALEELDLRLTSSAADSTRAVEQMCTEFATGEIPGFVHLYAGEEAIAAGVCAHLGPDDYVASTHRGHGHSIAKGCDVTAMMAEIYGKRAGICHGKGGSMHIADLSKGMLGANGIVGGGPPLVCGVGLTAKVRGSDQVAVSFTGDGGSNQGTFLESLNLAAAWHLPVVFVVENNGYAESTSPNFHQNGVDMIKRADGFGLPGISVDGFDFFAVHEAAGEAIARARSGGGATLVECKGMRYYGHFEGDQQTYRAAGEVDEVRRTRDCLVAFARRVTDAGIVDDDDLAAIDASVAQLIDDAVAQAKAGDDPTPDEVLTDVYLSY
jgi:acetoin:2,6-dichlorophenolindophenol oxidoreductase subunit alpha